MTLRSGKTSESYRYRFDPTGRVFAGPRQLPVAHSLYYVDDGDVAGSLGSALPPLMADIIDVAAAVYIADRLSRRHLSRAGATELWGRILCLELPVREVARWRDAQVGAMLSETLALLTDDQWSLSFEPYKGSRRAAEVQATLFMESLQAPVIAALFSGGLDSLAGVATELLEPDVGSPLVVSVQTNKRIGAIQASLLQRLSYKLRRSPKAITVRFGLRRRKRKEYDKEERSQRTRGFAFVAAGAATALTAGATHLRVYENGVGAINLPYTPSQLGSQSTRSTHPAVLEGLSRIIARLSGKAFTIQQPFAFLTKTEVCRRLFDADCADLIPDTVSCDGFPTRLPGSPQCGLCTSCLLRRSGLFAAGLGRYDSGKTYRYDVLANGPPPERKSLPLVAMTSQVRDLERALSSSSPWHALVLQHPSLVEVAETLRASNGMQGTVEDALLDMYRHYCAEWQVFLRALPRDLAQAMGVTCAA